MATPQTICNAQETKPITQAGPRSPAPARLHVKLGKQLLQAPGVPAKPHIVSRGFFQRAGMAIQPQDICPSASLVGVGVSHVVPEDLPIAERAAARLAIAGQIHGAFHVVVMKTIVSATFRSWFGVVAANKEFRVIFYPFRVHAPGFGMMIQAKRRVLNRF